MSAASFGTWQTACFNAPDNTVRWTPAYTNTHTHTRTLRSSRPRLSSPKSQTQGESVPPSLCLPCRRHFFFLASLLHSNLECVHKWHVKEKVWGCLTLCSVPLSAETATQSHLYHKSWLPQGCSTTHCTQQKLSSLECYHLKSRLTNIFCGAASSTLWCDLYGEKEKKKHLKWKVQGSEPRTENKLAKCLRDKIYLS